MSPAPDAHALAVQHDAHDAFTGEPVDVLPPDEPRTPGWLPLLGVALFTGAAVVVLADRAPAVAPDTAAAASAAPAPPPAAPPRPTIEPLRGVQPQQPQRVRQLAPPQSPPPGLARPAPAPVPAPAPRPAPHR